MTENVEFENEILHLIDKHDDYTRGDLQAIVGALVRRIRASAVPHQWNDLGYCKACGALATFSIYGNGGCQK